MSSREGFSQVFIAALLVTGVGCSVVTSTSPPQDAPYLTANPPDRKALEALAQKQDRLLKTCTKPTSCEPLLYARGLAALFESRTRASTIFEQIAGMVPAGPLATVSSQWSEVLRTDGASPDARRALLSQYVIREVLTRESAPLQARTRSLEKRIEELSRQLELLKQIEQQRPASDSTSFGLPTAIPRE
jgi:hypothetical protein